VGAEWVIAGIEIATLVVGAVVGAVKVGAHAARVEAAIEKLAAQLAHMNARVVSLEDRRKHRAPREES
jgi:hypothetical protein